MPVSAMGCLGLVERDQEAAVSRRSANVPVAATGQPHAPLEAALGQLQAMDDGRAQLAWQQARPGQSPDRPRRWPPAPARRRPLARATKTSTSSPVSKMSTGGSQAGCCDPERTGLKKSLCRRSTLASIANASDHIQSRGNSRSIFHLRTRGAGRIRLEPYICGISGALKAPLLRSHATVQRGACRRFDTMP